MNKYIKALCPWILVQEEDLKELKNHNLIMNKLKNDRKKEIKEFNKVMGNLYANFPSDAAAPKHCYE